MKEETMKCIVCCGITILVMMLSFGVFTNCQAASVVKESTTIRQCYNDCTRYNNQETCLDLCVTEYKIREFTQ